MPKGKRQYLVVACYACKRFLLAASDTRTRSCPYCGKRLSLEDAKVFARSADREEVQLALRKLKMREGRPEPMAK